MRNFKSALTFALCLSANVVAERLYIPPVYHNGSVEVEGLSVAGNLDGPKMRTAANRTSFDFWYFDAFSTSTKAAINIVFYNTGDFAANPNPLAVQVSGTFDNGTQFSGQVFASKGVVIDSDEDGISASWDGSGASFRGTSLEKPNPEYNIKLDSPSIGITGSVRLQARAPPHYPCNPNVEELNTLLLPHLHWANAVPDAVATVNLKINGTSFRIANGVGYHDKNWGDASVITSPKYWDWGHARLGPYSVVWYDLLDYSNNEHAYAYVVKDGRFVSVICAANAVQVRQSGPNATYPPTGGIPEATGLTARFDLGGGQVFALNLTKEAIVHDETVYARALGSVTGGIENQQTYNGRAHYEEYVYGLLFG
ncbi:hypothetical protein BDW72DRAFT_211316 [Aspergillus terricola var. indicus]